MGEIAEPDTKGVDLSSLSKIDFTIVETAEAKTYPLQQNPKYVQTSYLTYVMFFLVYINKLHLLYT